MKASLVQNPTTMTYRTKLDLSWQNILSKLQSNTVNKTDKLSFAINYLQSLKSTNKDAAGFIEDSQKIMSILDNEYKDTENYKPWVRYFDIINKVKADYAETDIFKDGINQIVKDVLLHDKLDVDWRIAKKMLDVKNVFADFDTDGIINSVTDSVKKQISKAQEILLWKEGSKADELTKDTLQELLAIVNNQESKELFQDAIRSGRFDKAALDLKDTIIFGEDGGLYLLLNDLDPLKKSMITEVMGEEYLADKVKAVKENSESIVIGKGGFGTVRFGLSLFKADSNPGDIICVKKTKSFEGLAKEADYFRPIMNIVTENTMGDYFTNNIAKTIYAPKVLDMAMVTNKDIVDPDHQKGYLMMDLLPQNTATKIFAEPKYQKWEYQKPYLIDVVQSLNIMLGDNVVMTDLKPDNTLYDQDIRKASIIDLGGSIKVNSQNELKNFNPSSYPFQFTKGYDAPELHAKHNIDLTKTVSYSYGKLLQNITQNTDYIPKENIESLANNLTNIDPKQRLSTEVAIDQLMQLGNDDYKESAIFTNYINKIQSRLANNKSSISINADIEETRNTLIELESTHLDPARYKDLKTAGLFDKIDAFFNSDNQAFLLLGGPGSGKSTPHVDHLNSVYYRPFNHL